MRIEFCVTESVNPQITFHFSLNDRKFNQMIKIKKNSSKDLIRINTLQELTNTSLSKEFYNFDLANYFVKKSN